MMILRISRFIALGAIAQNIPDFPDKVPLFESNFTIQNIFNGHHTDAFKNIHTAQFVRLVFFKIFFYKVLCFRKF